MEIYYACISEFALFNFIESTPPSRMPPRRRRSRDLSTYLLGGPASRRSVQKLKLQLGTRGGGKPKGGGGGRGHIKHTSISYNGEWCHALDKDATF
jgi:hypothetical protein